MNWLFWWSIGAFEFLLGYVIGVLLARSSRDGFPTDPVRQWFKNPPSSR